MERGVNRGGVATSNCLASTAGEAVWVKRPHMGGKPSIGGSAHAMNQEAEQTNDVSGPTNMRIDWIH